jgi:hypothetical protein
VGQHGLDLDEGEATTKGKTGSDDSGGGQGFYGWRGKGMNRVNGQRGRVKERGGHGGCFPS